MADGKQVAAPESYDSVDEDDAHDDIAGGCGASGKAPAAADDEAESFLNFVVRTEMIRSGSEDDLTKAGGDASEERSTVLMRMLDLRPGSADPSEVGDADQTELEEEEEDTEPPLQPFSSSPTKNEGQKWMPSNRMPSNRRSGGDGGGGGLNRSMEEVIGRCMRRVCKERGLALGNIWVQGDGDFLVTTARHQTFKGGNEGLAFFGEQCLEITFQKGQGLPGTSWKSGEPVWIKDVTTMSLEQYPRLNLAKACGVRCSFTIPFNVCGTTLAVLEFVMAEEMEESREVIDAVGRQLREALVQKVNGGLTQSSSQVSISSPMGSIKAEKDTSANHMSRPLRLKAVSEQWNIHRKDVTLGAKLAEGEQGIVYKASWRGMPVAAKTLKISSTSKTNEVDFYHEVSVLSHLRHPNLVLFLGACLEDSPAWILNEYLEGGSVEGLFERKSLERGGRPWRPLMKQTHRWATELARALAFLHNCDPPIIHRDLKPSNLLLSADGNLKVADFGLSKIVMCAVQSGQYEMTGLTGTVRYMAPEVMQSQKYNEKVDIYSYGLIVWCMATGERPFDDVLRRCAQREDFSNAIIHGARPETDRIQPETLSKILEICWQQNFAERPSATDVLNYLEKVEVADKKKAALRPKGQQGNKCSIQ